MASNSIEGYLTKLNLHEKSLLPKRQFVVVDTLNRVMIWYDTHEKAKVVKEYPLSVGGYEWQVHAYELKEDPVWAWCTKRIPPGKLSNYCFRLVQRDRGASKVKKCFLFDPEFEITRKSWLGAFKKIGLAIYLSPSVTDEQFATLYGSDKAAAQRMANTPSATVSQAGGEMPQTPEEIAAYKERMRQKYAESERERKASLGANTHSQLKPHPNTLAAAAAAASAKQAGSAPGTPVQQRMLTSPAVAAQQQQQQQQQHSAPASPAPAKSGTRRPMPTPKQGGSLSKSTDALRGGASATPANADAPSNAELYEMIKKLQAYKSEQDTKFKRLEDRVRRCEQTVNELRQRLYEQKDDLKHIKEMQSLASIGTGGGMGGGLGGSGGGMGGGDDMMMDPETLAAEQDKLMAEMAKIKAEMGLPADPPMPAATAAPAKSAAGAAKSSAAGSGIVALPDDLNFDFPDLTKAAGGGAGGAGGGGGATADDGLITLPDGFDDLDFGLDMSMGTSGAGGAATKPAAKGGIAAQLDAIPDPDVLMARMQALMGANIDFDGLSDDEEKETPEERAAREKAEAEYREMERKKKESEEEELRREMAERIKLARGGK